MNELLEKISSYNLFNNLIPGFVFVAVYQDFYDGAIFGESVYINFALAYAIGVAISRIGSLVISPILDLTGLLKRYAYQEYIALEKEGPKTSILLETANSYRTLAACFLVLMMVSPIQLILSSYPLLDEYRQTIFLLSLFSLGIFSFIKQSSFVRKRIGHKK